MMADAITFDLGGFPPIAFQLASSEGLAPLPLPQSLPQPSPDAVRLFQAAMERDEGEVTRGGAEGDVTRRGAETQRTVGGEVLQTGFTGLTEFERGVEPSEAQRTGEVVTKSDFAPLGVDQTPRSENPVNPVQKEVPTTLNPVKEEAPIRTTQDLRAETQRTVGGEVFQTGLTGLTGFEKTVEPSSKGEVVTKPDFAPIGVENTIRPENPVNPVNPVQKEVPTEINTVVGDAPVVPQAGEFVSRGVAETQRTVGGEVYQTGLTGLTGFEKAVEPSSTGEVVTKPDFAPLGVGQTPHPENPVNPVNPVQKEVPTEINTVVGDAPVVPQAGEFVSRGVAETQRTVGGEVYQTGLTGLTGFEKAVEPSSTGEVVTKPDFAPIGVENTPRPENPVNPVNPVQKELPTELNPVKEEAPIRMTQDLRAETQRAVGGEVFQTGLTGLTGFEKTVEPSSTGEVVAKPAFAPLGVDQTPRPENPVNLVNPVQKGLPTELNTVAVDAPVVPLREMEDGAVEAPAALPSAAQPAPLAAASELPEVQQVAAAQSARTEAVVATVARMVETVNQIVEAVAAEIAVSPTLASGNGDIRITLKPTVLDGSEIRLTAQSGELTVSIAPATPAAAALATAALPRLETALAEHAPSFHHIAVVVATARKGKEK